MLGPEGAALVDSAVASHLGLQGYHAEEWNRFIVQAPTFEIASAFAARLGWWLHCWAWEAGPTEQGIKVKENEERKR